jgi:arsenite-transporting ATPase
VRVRFFGGKGGVGKTTCSAATALAGAARGARVLLVSTDPAHSLGDALSLRLSSRARKVLAGKGGLWALELDADRALWRWVSKRRAALSLAGARGTYLLEEEVERFLGLPVPGVDELLALVEVRRIAEEGGYQEVVVDTAPTGHTLRMLAMPGSLRRMAAVLDAMQEKHRVLSRSLGRYRPDAAEELIEEIEREGEELERLLRDPQRVSFSWVTVAEPLAVAESADGIAALESQGIRVDELIVNRLTKPPRARCGLCEGRVRVERAALLALRTWAPGRTVRLVYEIPREPRGLRALGSFAASLRRARSLRPPAARRRRPSRASRPDRAVGEGLPLEPPPTLKLLFFGGKGGVGKTTCAAAAAIALARREPKRRVLLLSTDPAHSLRDVLGVEPGEGEFRLPGGPAGLRGLELDAANLFAERRERYRAEVEAFFDGLTGPGGDSSLDRRVARDLLELAPPGLDELFAILWVMEAVARPAGKGAHDLVVVDTAPTGHALRLLAMPEGAHRWVREMLSVLARFPRRAEGLTRGLVDLARGLRLLREALADGGRTRFVAVTRPAELPRLETRRLLLALRRLGITPAAVLVNGLTPPGCARCRRAARVEAVQLRSIRRLSRLSRREACAIITAPAAAPPPRGVAGLARWGRSWRSA